MSERDSAAAAAGSGTVRAHSPWRALALSATAALYFGGCYAGSAGDGEGSFTPISEGSDVAILAQSAPNTSSFILRGTFPVPPRTYPRNDGLQPFAIAEYDGTLVETQTEIVSRYADADDGADVVEVIARVRMDPAVNPGDRVTHRVVSAPHEPRPDPGTPGVEDLANGPNNVPTSIRTMLANPGSILIRGHDCFGNRYTDYLLDGFDDMKLLRYGAAQAELRTYDVLRPDPPVAGSTGTLPHLLGVHAYISTYSAEELVSLDLRFHNGNDGNDTTTNDDDALGTVYFRDLEVVVPQGWFLDQLFDDPFFGASYNEGGSVVYPIVLPISTGDMHVMRWQSQFHRRLVISPPAGSFAAGSLLRESGHAISQRGVDPMEGHEYYSWWNENTARYFPQSYQLPSLDHYGVFNLRDELGGEMEGLANVVAGGGNWGDYPVASSVLGWGHPYGIAYGGMTGGAEIHVSDGIRLANAASNKGLRKTMLVHRMHTDRMPTALYRSDGEPSSVEDWLVLTGGDGSNDYVPFEHFLYPVLSSGDPFGVGNAPQFQVNHVQGTGLVPWYEGQHFGFDGHDYQHFIRYTRSAKVLAWLRNDSLAKDDLKMQAENFRLSYHPYKNSSFGNIQGSGMRSAQSYVDANFMVGFPFGRGEGWGTDCVNAAYATGDPAWRTKVRPWFDEIAVLINEGQGGCNGFIQALVSNKFVNGLYRARQAIEQAIMENMIRGMIETVYRGEDAGMTAMLDSVLHDSLLAFISPMAWFPGESAPWTYTGVGPPMASATPWCSMSQMPADAWTPAHENFQNWSSFAYGFESVGSAIFLNMATIQIGGGDLLTELESEGTDNIENMASLLALMQRMNGDI